MHTRLRRSEARGAFGLHVWGPCAAEPTAWEKPLQASGEDWFGLYFDVALASASAASAAASADASPSPSPALALLLHRGDAKRASLEFAAVADVPLAATEVWIGHAPGFVREEPESANVPAGDLDTCGARAHWLCADTIAWRVLADVKRGNRFVLHYSNVATNFSPLTDLGARGVGGSLEIELSFSASALTPALAKAHPYLEGCTLLSFPTGENLPSPRELCRNQLAVSMHSPEGEAVDSTGVQVGALLDDLFAYDGPLGCYLADDGSGATTYPPSTGPSLALWAPAAISVEAVVYDNARGPASETLPMSRGDADNDDGVWRISGTAKWWGKYYTYKVEAYYPANGRMATAETADPYSRACSADAGRTLICHLPAWGDAAPGGNLGMWRAHKPPPLACREAASVYELHVRDFSATDKTVPSELRGKYLAFELEGTCGDKHLRRLAAAGLTHVQLLPTYDFGSVPERAEDRTEPSIPSDLPPDSDAQQAALVAVQDQDSFNWGYDPVLFDVPEGSYATEPDGVARVLEHRRMVAALHAKGLRLIVDVVYNHTLASGPEGAKSILDKCVPGYYYRRSETGAYENSTCMNNTASERVMMERLIVDSVLHWATEYRVDGFRFDLMGHLTLRAINRCRAALDALTSDEHGIDGRRIILHGEGWEFGEIARGQRGPVAVQQQLAGTGIGSFNDRMRDAALGGSPFADARMQGFATGLALKPWPVDAGVDQGSAAEQTRALLIAADKLRISLMGSLREYKMEEDCDGNLGVRAGDAHGGGVGYTGSPGEILNYVSAHDNETLYDNTVWKMPPSLFSPVERMRANWLCTSLVALSHGVPFFHAGDEVLRSKSLDRDSYNSGDWFNVLDFTGERSAFGVGLPVASKNGEKWDLIRPLLKDPSLRPTREMAAASTAKFCELLSLRASTPLIGLLTAADVMEKVDFPGCGSKQLPGIIVMQTRNGPPANAPPGASALCPCFARVVIVFSACTEEMRVAAPPALSAAALPLRLHPLQMASADAVTQTAKFDAAAAELVVPPQGAYVFVEPLLGYEG